MDCHLRRLAGMPKRRTQASVAPPVVYERTWSISGWIRVAWVAAVVDMVRVAVPAVVPVMFTGLVGPKLSKTPAHTVAALTDDSPYAG